MTDLLTTRQAVAFSGAPSPKAFQKRMTDHGYTRTSSTPTPKGRFALWSLEDVVLAFNGVHHANSSKVPVRAKDPKVVRPTLEGHTANDYWVGLYRTLKNPNRPLELREFEYRAEVWITPTIAKPAWMYPELDGLWRWCLNQTQIHRLGSGKRVRGASSYRQAA